jgi:hypothetical protein
MKCPRCRLYNPDEAERCDCGYDFHTKAIHAARFKEGLPGVVVGYGVFLAIVHGLIAVIAVATANAGAIALIAVQTLIVLTLYMQMVAKRNRARIALVVLTFPVGLFLLGTRVRLYCLQL